MMVLRVRECLQNNIHEVRGRSIWIQKEPVETRCTHMPMFILLSLSLYFSFTICVLLWTIMCLCSLNKNLPACRWCMCMYESEFTAGYDLLSICEGLNNIQHAASLAAPHSYKTAQPGHIFWRCLPNFVTQHDIQSWKNNLYSVSVKNEKWHLNWTCHLSYLCQGCFWLHFYSLVSRKSQNYFSEVI